MKPDRSLAAAVVAAAIAASRAMVSDSTCVSVPSRMQLSDVMRQANLGKANLYPLLFESVQHTDSSSSSSKDDNAGKDDGTDAVASITTVVKEIAVSSGTDVIKSHTGKYGSLCFVVRRPG